MNTELNYVKHNANKTCLKLDLISIINFKDIRETRGKIDIKQLIFLKKQYY